MGFGLFEAAGNAYRGLGEFATAEKLLGQAEQLRKGDAATSPIDHAKVLLSRATLTLAQGSFDAAEALARSSIEILEREPAATGLLSRGAEGMKTFEGRTTAVYPWRPDPATPSLSVAGQSASPSRIGRASNRASGGLSAACAGP